MHIQLRSKSENKIVTNISYHQYDNQIKNNLRITVYLITNNMHSPTLLEQHFKPNVIQEISMYKDSVALTKQLQN
jgi:hypothetical protein